MKEKTLTVTEAARNFAELVNRAHYRHESTLLIRNNLPVARIVPVVPTHCTTHELADRWNEIPHLTSKEAEEFEKDIKESRKILTLPKSKWD